MILHADSMTHKPTDHAKECQTLFGHTHRYSGDFGGQASVMYDKNMKLYINDEWFDYKNHPTKRHQYLIVFIRCEFNDMFPQD